MDPLLTDDEVQNWLRVDVKTLERWRRERSGPPFIRAGRQVRYRAADVEHWLTKQTNGAHS